MCATLLCGCAGEETATEAPADRRLTLPDVSDQWTYVSLETGKIMGQCALTDTAAQRLWAARPDWDLAICNGMIRTNSGTSGAGKGGITPTAQPYEQVDDPTAPHYETDRDTLLS